MKNQMPTLNPALRDFWEAPARIKVLYGGRSSSKSWDAAGAAIFLTQMCKIRFLCTRQFQSKIEESVYNLLKSRIAEFGLIDDYIITNNKITHKYTGSEFIFYGMWRNFEEIKSLEGVDICWIEEANFLTAEQWRDLEPTIRKEGSQIWMIFNPGLVTDFTWRNFVVDPRHNSIVRKINYDENPFLSDTIKEVISAAFKNDEIEAGHVYLGIPRTDDDQVIIKRSWIEAAIDAHIVLGIDYSGSKRIGYDIADDGDDKNATVSVDGILAYEVDEWQGKKDDLLGSCSHVYGKARSSRSRIYYDCIGVGATAGSKFKELNTSSGDRIMYTAFRANGKVHEPDRDWDHNVINGEFFSNLKAQSWGMVGRRFLNTFNAVKYGQKFDVGDLISISSSVSHIDKLIDELSTPRVDYDGAGKMKVESKDDLKKRNVPSPNLADAFIQAYSPAVVGMVDYGDLL